MLHPVFRNTIAVIGYWGKPNARVTVADRDPFNPWLRAKDVFAFYFYDELWAVPDDGSPWFVVGSPKPAYRVQWDQAAVGQTKMSPPYYVGYKVRLQDVLDCGADIACRKELQFLAEQGYDHGILSQHGTVCGYDLGDVVVPPLIRPQLRVLRALERMRRDLEAIASSVDKSAILM